MGFLKGTLTFSSFRVAGDDPPNFGKFFDERIKKFSFPDFAPQGQETVWGWTDIENHLDTKFAGAKYAVGPYLLFALRADKKAAPPALLRIKCLEAERDIAEERKLKRLSKALRDEIRESISNELLNRILPVPSFFEVCWHPQEKRLYFSGLADKVIDDFHFLFKDSFSLTLQPYYPWDPSCMSAERAAAMSSVDGALWGREFLTWLWCKSEERNGAIALSKQEEIELIFTRRIVLASGDGDYSEQVVCQGLHAGLEEGKEALRRGKKIKEARIRLGIDSDVYEFTFKADRFHFQSMKLPETLDEEGEDDKDGRNLERLYLIDRPCKIMEKLFDVFLNIRLSPKWEQEETGRMNKWLERI